jgi:HNH endonuclease
MTLIELIGEPTNVKNADLNKMYEREENFDSSGPKAKKIRRTLEYLLTAFPNKTPELERYSVVSLYVLVSHMLERYVVQNMHQKLAEWFITFESYRRGQHELSVDQCDPEIVQYQEKTSHSTDSEDSIQWRHDYLLGKFLEAHPSIQLKDDQRLFTHDQRMAIFRRDKGICQVRLKCAGQECSWDSWEADHKHPWSQGGKTTVENGQVACLACNASKGGIVQTAA